MATLTNTKIKDTYDGLLKTTDNEALDVSGVTLIEDGLGNASALSVGRSGNGVTITGSLNATLATAAQPNITSVGTLSSLAVSGLVSVATNRFKVDTDGSISLNAKGQFSDPFTSSWRQIFFGSNGTLISREADNFANLTLGNNYYVENQSGSAVNVRRTGAAVSGISFSGADITFNSDSATGVAGSTTTPTEKMRIDSSGNVGIGTQSPNKLSFLETQLAVEGSGDSGVHIVGNRASGGLGLGYLTFINNGSSVTSFNKRIAAIVSSTDSNAESGNLQFSTANSSGTLSEAMRIDSSGNVGIGTQTINATYLPKLQVQGTSNDGTEGVLISSYLPTLTFQDISGGATIGQIQQDGTGLVFKNNGSERMRITSEGDVFFGCISSPSNTVFGAGIQVHPSGGRYIETSINQTGTATQIQFVNPNGNVGTIQTTGSSTSYNTSSDYRLKENVVEMTGALDRVDALKPSRFNFIADPETTVDGFLAHEVAEVIPEAISGEKDAVDEEGNPIYQGIDQSKIVPLLVGAIKELRAEIELLKAK